MRQAWGVVAIALAFALSGCDSPVGTVGIVDFVAVEDVPACLTYPTELAGTTYWMLGEDMVSGWEQTHEDPYGGTPQPQASAAWDTDADEHGVLYRYEDGSALYISTSGNRIWFDQTKRTYDGYC